MGLRNNTSPKEGKQDRARTYSVQKSKECKNPAHNTHNPCSRGDFFPPIYSIIRIQRAKVLAELIEHANPKSVSSSLEALWYS